MRVNISIVYSIGDLFALSFLDVARYLRHLLIVNKVPPEDISISKNRLHYDSVNIVLGAHKAPEADRYKDYCCVFVNLEQLGSGGKSLSSEYLELLERNLVIDYHQKNTDLYRPKHSKQEVPLLVFGYAPYLSRYFASPKVRQSKASKKEVVFLGSMNSGRVSILRQIEAQNVSVRIIEMVFGPEKDVLLSSSPTLVNIPFYSTGIFEQVRVFQALSLGVPVISIFHEQMPLDLPAIYAENILWLRQSEIDEFFARSYLTPQYICEQEKRILGFKSDSESISNGSALELIYESFAKLGSRKNIPIGSLLGSEFKINIGSGKDYRLGWLNIDICESLLPDICLDLGKSLQLPLTFASNAYGLVRLRQGCCTFLYADNVLEHVADLPVFMENCLCLLKTGCEMVATVPFEGSKGAWQDPTHVRAMNENSWKYFAEWSWYLGWFEYRFHVKSVTYLDRDMKPKAHHMQPSFMRVTLVKQALTPREKSVFRAQLSDWGPIYDEC